MKNIYFCVILSIFFAINNVISQSAEIGIFASNNKDIDAIMKKCNETYLVDMAYILSLNESGTFHDEISDKPKCFLKCVYEKLDLINKEGVLNTEKLTSMVTEVYNGTLSVDPKVLVENCVKNRTETCPCEKTYEFMKCVMEAVVDS